MVVLVVLWAGLTVAAGVSLVLCGWVAIFGAVERLLQLLNGGVCVVRDVNAVGSVASRRELISLRGMCVLQCRSDGERTLAARTVATAGDCGGSGGGGGNCGTVDWKQHHSAGGVRRLLLLCAVRAQLQPLQRCC